MIVQPLGFGDHIHNQTIDIFKSYYFRSNNYTFILMKNTIISTKSLWSVSNIKLYTQGLSLEINMTWQGFFFFI